MWDWYCCCEEFSVQAVAGTPWIPRCCYVVYDVLRISMLLRLLRGGELAGKEMLCERKERQLACLTVVVVLDSKRVRTELSES